MPRSQQAKLSFSSGAISPRLSLRADQDYYSSSLRQAINFIISPQGGGVMRHGFEHLEVTTQNRLFQWHNGGNTSDIQIEILPNGNIDFHGDDVYANLVGAHTYTIAQLDELYFVNQENIGVIVHAAYPPLYLEQVDGVFSAAFLPADKIPFADYKDSKSPAASITISVGYSLDFVNGPTSTWNPSRLWTLSYDGVFATGGQGNPKEYEFSSTAATLAARVDDALNLIPALSGATILVVGGAAGTDWTLIDITLTGPNSGMTLKLEPVNTSADRYVDVTPTSDERDVLETAWSYPTYVFHTANYYQCILAHTSELATNEPPNATYWTDLGTTKPTTFDYQYPTGNVWAEDINYSPGDRGFPTVSAIHQQRLLLMANPGFTMGIFGSRINVYKDFERGPNDDDPFFFAIDTSDTPTIKWAEAQRHLTLGTSSGDFLLRGEVTLSPSDVSAFKQNNARSYRARAVTLNTDIIYIEQGNTKVRTSSFQRGADTVSSEDISLIAEHLLHRGVKRLVSLQTPEAIVIALGRDGTLVAFSYKNFNGPYRDRGVFSWWEIETQGFVYDISGYHSALTNEDSVFLTVRYGSNYYLEHMPYPSRTFTPYEKIADTTLTAQGVVLMDSWIAGTAVNNVITGLGHLEGMLVAALVDDAWTGTYTVAGGQITLDDANISGSDPYNGISVVGLLYKGTIETFEEASGNQRGIGFGSKRRWSRLFVRTLDSALPIINGVLPPDRTPATQMDIAETVRMGVQNHEMRGVGWGDGSILIEQDRPYPTQVLGCYGEYGLGNA